MLQLMLKRLLQHMNKDVTDQQLLASLKRLERLADLSDSRFRVPFTKIRFGIDGIIGLIPFVGDSISLLMSLYLIFEASKLGAPLSIKFKMLRNTIIDWLIGLVPVLGDVIDVFYKANNQNIKLLLDHINQDFQSRQANTTASHTKRHKSISIILILTLFVLLGIFAVFIVQ